METRAEARQALCFALVLLELLGDQLVCLVPARLDKLPILLDERLCQAVRTVDKFRGIVALRAELAVIDRIAVPRCYADNLLVLDNKVEAATGPAIRTRGWYVLHFHVLTSNKKNFGLTIFKHSEFFAKSD